MMYDKSSQMIHRRLTSLAKADLSD